MTRSRLAATALLLAASAAALGGCISLLPKQAPAQLYRFDARAVAPAVAADDAPRAEVIAPPVVVARSAATDRLLAATGPEVAFIGGARWVAPAAVLWDETVRRAFAARSARVRLLSRNEVAGGRAFLRLDVPEFEVRYPAPGAAPTVRVVLHALYTHRDGGFSAEHTFTADAPAAADRVSAIVSAFDAGVEQVTAGLVAWADAHAAEAVAEPAPPAGAEPAVRVTRSTTSTTVARPSRP